MCAGANSNAKIIRRIDLLSTPLNRNITEGIMESAKALKTVFLFQQTIQSTQYSTVNRAFPIRYTAKALLDHQPNHVPGMLKIIKPKQPNLPICSIYSIARLFHLFSKPPLHFTAKTILGIMITIMNNNPKTLNHSIESSHPIFIIITAADNVPGDAPEGA